MRSMNTQQSIWVLLLVIGWNYVRHANCFVVPTIRPSASLNNIAPSEDTKEKISVLYGSSDNEDDNSDDSSTPKNKRESNGENSSDAKKEELLKAVGERMRQQQSRVEEDSGLLDKLNPFRAGQNLRKQLDTALTSINIPEERKSIYYFDDRFTSLAEDGLSRLTSDDYVPEILVVGATGEVGRLVVKRLLQEGRSRVRVLVRDLYTKTLNMLGTGVTYCQGDLSNVDSLEYAVTDVDKIIFCATAPRADEEQFQEKFLEFVEENLEDSKGDSPELASKDSADDKEWEQLESILRVRAQLAEQVDLVGLNNVIQAFLNVRHSDYGTSQAAKRSLFKFQRRPEDFELFGIDDGTDDGALKDESQTLGLAEDNDIYSDFEDVFEDDGYDDDEIDEYDGDVEQRKDSSVKIQTQWIRNKFGHGVFVGRVPKAIDGKPGGEAAIVSSRLRSRQDPESGIDLGVGFGGFIARVCGDGGTYEAFVRTKEYYENGIEYVCKFSTETKTASSNNKSRNKFVTARLPFTNFKPVQITDRVTKDIGSVPPFRGSDIRNIGFRYRSSENSLKMKLEPGEWSSFYLGLSYIKLYRSQPEPEFVYLSDAKVPPVVQNGMVRHEAKQLALASGSDSTVQLFDGTALQSVANGDVGRVSSPEETYYKYRGEEIVKSSGLNYAIARISGFNELESGETTTIDLQPNNEDVTAMSRAEIAQVCVSAVMDPNALNKSFYVTKKKGAVKASDDDMKQKFKALPSDLVK